MTYNKVHEYLNENSPVDIKWDMIDDRGTWGALYDDKTQQGKIDYYLLGNYQIDNINIDTKDPFVDWDKVEMPDVTVEILDNCIVTAVGHFGIDIQQPVDGVNL